MEDECLAMPFLPARQIDLWIGINRVDDGSRAGGVSN